MESLMRLAQGRGIGHIQEEEVESDNEKKIRFSRKFDDTRPNIEVITLPQAACSTRAFRRSSFPRPYIIRLISFSRCSCPSVWPLLHSYVLMIDMLLFIAAPRPYNS